MTGPRGRYRPPRTPHVKLPVTPDFEGEEQRFRLVHHCEDCALYDPQRPARDRCAHGFPTAEHERASRTDALVFCKDFEAA